jgi:hypothetical protein
LATVSKLCFFSFLLVFFFFLDLKNGNMLIPHIDVCLGSSVSEYRRIMNE